MMKGQTVTDTFFAKAIVTALGMAALVACSGAMPDGNTVQLDPGEVEIYSFDSDEPMMVSWSHEGDADTALACQGKRLDPMAFPLPTCAGIYESDGTDIIEGSTYAEGLHGAGVTFQPEGGKIVVALKNISKVPLDLSVEVKPNE